MDRPFGTEINLRNFLLQTFTRPISNIRSDEYVPFGRNMLFIIALSFLVVPVGILRFSMYPHQQENDLSINIFLELINIAGSLYFLLIFTLVASINIMLIYFITKKKKRLEELISDHSIIFIYTFIIFIVGIFTMSSTIMDGYFSAIPLFIHGFALLVYAIGSCFILFTYLESKFKLIICVIYFIFLIVLIAFYIAFSFATLTNLLWFTNLTIFWPIG